MEWTDISITVAKRDADTAEAIATMVANGERNIVLAVLFGCFSAHPAL